MKKKTVADRGERNKATGRTNRASSFAELLQGMRDAIAEGDFSGKTILSEKVIADQLLKDGVRATRMPLRRAIAVLQGEGILSVLDKRGTTIERPGETEIREIWHSIVQLGLLCIDRLARDDGLSLADSIAVHLKMQKFVRGKNRGIPNTTELREYRKLYRNFHHSLAVAAGYPNLAEIVRSFGFKLELAAPLEAFSSWDRLQNVVKEHEKILLALGENVGQDDIRPAGKNKGVGRTLRKRPNINAARHAFLLHMQSCAKDGLRISQRISKDQHEVQLPDLPPPPSESLGGRRPLANLVEMRFNLEACTAVQLTDRSDVDLTPLEHLNREMRTLAGDGKSEKRLAAEIESRFISLDIRFHGMLCVLAGMLFGEEIISYSWHLVHDFQNYRLTEGKAGNVTDEHQAILSALRECRIPKADPKVRNFDQKRVVRAILEHLITGAFTRNNMNIDLLDEIIAQKRDQLDIYEQVKKQIDKRKTRC